MLFTHYRVPRECLLNKHSDVTPSGEYIKAGQNQKDGKGGEKRYNASLGALSVGRIGITGKGKSSPIQKNFTLNSVQSAFHIPYIFPDRRCGNCHPDGHHNSHSVSLSLVSTDYC